MKRVFMLLMCLMISCAVFAASVPVVYLDRSSTNLEASSYIKKQAKSNKLPHKFTFTSDLSSLSGDEKVVVILNSGLSSGTDPRISSYLNSSQNKQAIILVNLYSIGKNILMTSVSSADTASGVDEISAATQWKKRDSAIQAMHEQWTEELFRLIQVKQEL
ncbi:MAG: hypothetical protein AB7S66_12065 [Sphaerochaeta sp.]|uniref:hypothetical protein n=1 Tax=Sphaerochaeta sp. TaxID=1972642 RepID=UPI003D0F5A58